MDSPDENNTANNTANSAEDNTNDAVRQAGDLVQVAERVVVLTGAGISTDSGIPDFRGPKGVWTKNPEAEKMATLQNYVADAEVRRRAWQSRLNSEAFTAQPNSGHRALLELEKQDKLHTLITQNVDGLHQKAGSSAGRVVEIHGTIHEVTCLSCADTAPMEVALDRVRAGEEDPECKRCGGILKSATISFGQGLVEADIDRAMQAAENCDLFLAVGTTLAVYPIAGALPLARRSGARVIIVNGESTAMDELADVVVVGSIAEVLPPMLGL